MHTNTHTLTLLFLPFAWAYFVLLIIGTTIRNLVVSITQPMCAWHAQKKKSKSSANMWKFW